MTEPLPRVSPQHSLPCPLYLPPLPLGEGWGEGIPPQPAPPNNLAAHILHFARALRRSGVAIDSARIALAQQAAVLVGVANKADFCAALEAVLLSRAPDRAVFQALFEAYFETPNLTSALLALTPPAPDHSPSPQTPGQRRARDAMAAPTPERAAQNTHEAPLTASAAKQLQQADFNTLSAAEYQHLERLAQELALPLPRLPTRRNSPGPRGARLHWPGVYRHAARTGGELMELPRLSRRKQPLPLVVLVDVSASMQRYARLLLVFLHAATAALPRRDVFAFGTDLTDLTPAFGLADPDAMLQATRQAMTDFGGGTRLGAALACLRQQHARRLVGGRSLVLLITDGLDTGEPAALAQELIWLKRHSRRLLWLNPLLRFDGYSPSARGAAVLHQQVHGSLAVHSLSRLKDLAQSLSQVLKQ